MLIYKEQVLSVFKDNICFKSLSDDFSIKKPFAVVLNLRRRNNCCRPYRFSGLCCCSRGGCIPPLFPY